MTDVRENFTPPEHFRYALVLDVAVKVGLAILSVSFLVYVLGLIPAHVPVDQLHKYWGLPVKEYLAQTGTPHGWGWLSLIGSSDILNFFGVTVLSGISGLCFLVLIPFYAIRRDITYTIITLLNLGVLLIAAWGAFGNGS
ncbi:MAG TPA: hypothetical protein VEG37_07510 [Burkholderiales bacterium]|nr:hypothetical protein [Burkholderiales bacterium]